MKLENVVILLMRDDLNQLQYKINEGILSNTGCHIKDLQATHGNYPVCSNEFSLVSLTR